MISQSVKEAVALISHNDTDTDDRERAAAAAWRGMTPGQKECLSQLLLNGPVWDGDITSKSDRGELFNLGLAVRCCFKGEQGYTAATYPAFTIYRCGNRQINELKRIARFAS